MKLVVIINNLNKGGAEKLLVNFLPKLDELEISVLLLNEAQSEQSYVATLRSVGITVQSLSNYSIYDPRNIFKLKRAILEINPDIVHAHLFPTMYWVAMALTLIPKRIRPKAVFTEHSTQNRRFGNPSFKWIDRWVYKRFQKILAISPAIKDILDEWNGTPDKNLVLRNGVDLSSISELSAYSGDSWRAKLDLPSDAFLMLMCARFLPPKRQDLVLQTLKLLPVNVIMLFAGDGNDLEKMKSLAETLGVNSRVRFLGFRSDAIQLMKSVDLNLIISDYEGMSGAVLEAAASGQPFIASDVPGINDVIPIPELLVENSVNEIFEKISIFVNTPTYYDSLRSFVSAKTQNYTLDRMKLNHRLIYDELIK